MRGSKGILGRLMIGATVLITLLALGEITLRVTLGLGHPIVLQSDPELGYYVRPDQAVVRFGKHIHYNHFSQRSDAISPARPPGTVRILMVGDSVLNGGNPVDQSQTVSELLRAQLAAAGYRAEVLAASAGGWAIGNRLAYLRKFGLFNSDLLIVQMGTEDLCQVTATYAQMRDDPNYYFRPSISSLGEAWTHYLWPHYLLPGWRKLVGSHPPETVGPPADAQFDDNMRALREIIGLARTARIPCWVIFTPYQADLLPNNGMAKYQQAALAILAQEQVPVLNYQERWSGLTPAVSAAYYRDGLHLTERGNQAVEQDLCTRLLPELKRGLGSPAPGLDEPQVPAP